MKKYITRIGIIALLVVITLVASGFNVGFNINADGFLSIGTVDISVNGKAKAAGIYDESWGYELILDNGDIVQIGDNTTDDFKAKVTTIRGINQNTWFSLGWLGGTFIPSVDNTTLHFDFNDNTHVSVYPVEPSERLPEGGIEYDITLDKKPAKPTVTLDIDWQNITWTKLYALDVEYTEQDCIDKWGETHTNFSINATTITGENIETSEIDVLKSRELYEINSYLGTATIATDIPSDYGEITDPESPNYGEHLFYHRISRTYLYIHRGQMTDALGQTDWVEDILLDEENKTITFELDSVWLRNATYPVSQVCGVDPAYTEEIISSGNDGTDGAWEEIDINTVFSLNLGTTNVVLEMMLENQQKGAENLIGVRATDSSLSRYVNLHEAEPDGGGGGDTHCRMFVQTITNGSSQQGIDIYTEDASDTEFYILGYWENVSFTEAFTTGQTSSEDDAWHDFDTLAGSPSLSADTVYQILAQVPDEYAYTVGVRKGGSSLDRKILLHEAESGGYSNIDFITKSDANADIETYWGSEGSYIRYVNLGYFSSELDFVELWQDINSTIRDWVDTDLTSYLDQDGRIVDVMMVHNDTTNPVTLGVRDGDDTSTNRYLVEHEAEDNGTSTLELTGFSMSTQTNSSGVIKVYSNNTDVAHYLTGYFLPAGGLTYDISNTPTSENLGTVYNDSTYYAYGSAPSNPVVDGECTFTITNNGDDCDIDMSIDDFTGGTSWNIVATSPSTNEVRVTAYYSGQNPASGLVLANTDAEFYDALSANATIKWDFKLETGTLANEDVQHSATLTVTAVAED